MSFTIICDNCGNSDVDIEIYDERLVLTCNECGQEETTVMVSEL
jgi:uncharacterized Zn finger protein